MADFCKCGSIKIDSKCTKRGCEIENPQLSEESIKKLKELYELGWKSICSKGLTDAAVDKLYGILVTVE